MGRGAGGRSREAIGCLSKNMADEARIVELAVPEKEKEEAESTKITQNGIRVALGAEGHAWDEWIEFKKDYTWLERVQWDEALDIARMKLLVSWALDWRLADVNGALIPFEKEALLENIGALNIPFQKFRLMVRAMWKAFAEAYSLPL